MRKYPRLSGPHPPRPRSILIAVLALLPGLLAIILAAASTVGSGTRQATAPAIRRASPTPSLPHGVPWQPTSLRIEVDALALDPAKPDQVIAGSVNGLWRSSDGGLSWTHLNGGPHQAAMLALAAGGTPRMLYAGDSNGGIWERTAQGRWLAIGPSPAPSSIFSLAISPTTPPVVLAGTAGALYRGQQVAGHWRWQVTARTDGSSFASLAWLPGDGRHALAAVFGSAPPVRASDDGGLTWKPASAGLPATLPTVTLLATNGQAPAVVLSTMGQGVWRRDTGGAWSEISAGLPERHAMPVIGIDGGSGLVAGTMGYGIFTRAATGSWRPLGSGLTGPLYIVLSLAQVGGPHPALLAGTGVGIYRMALGQ